MVPQVHRDDSESGDMVSTIQARIRHTLKYGGGSSGLSSEFSAGDPQQSERRRHALQIIDERADLVGFALSSGLKSLGRVSTLVREGLRRALLEVLFRQSEFNRSSGDLIRSHEAQLQALGATARAQIGVQVDADERLDALEERLARVEVAWAARADLDQPSFAGSLSGTAEERRERLRRFLPRFEGRSEVLDAGCDRGEFLDLLREAAIPSLGIDHGDSLEFLGSRAEESLGGIFAGHLIERLERGQIVEFARLAFSRLRPNGVLVLEAIDPVPALALQWLAESVGFASVEIEYASPVPEEQKLFGFQEYALTAYKPG